MFGISFQTTQHPDLALIAKQTRFGIAKGLTATAKDAQVASQQAIQGTFTVRGQWFAQSNKFGIRIKVAKPADLEADVHTAADWLELHEEGGTKTARTSHGIAVPEAAIRAPGSTKKITSAIRAGNLLRSGKAFILKTKSGHELIVQRKGRGKKKSLVILYAMTPHARIKKQSTFFEPIRKTCEANLEKNIAEGIEYAWANAKTS